MGRGQAEPPAHGRGTRRAGPPEGSARRPTCLVQEPAKGAAPQLRPTGRDGRCRPCRLLHGGPSTAARPALSTAWGAEYAVDVIAIGTVSGRSYNSFTGPNTRVKGETGLSDLGVIGPNCPPLPSGRGDPRPGRLCLTPSCLSFPVCPWAQHGLNESMFKC